MKTDKVRDPRVIYKNECEGDPIAAKAVDEVVSNAHNVYSQFGEDGIIEAIFDRIGVTNSWCFECGAANGIFLSNTRRLIESGWLGVLIEQDVDAYNELCRNSPTTWNGMATLSHQGEDTIDKILEMAGAPFDLDLMSLDIDGQEYYIINSMHKVRPRVIIVEHDPIEDNKDFIPEPGGSVGQAGMSSIQKMLGAKLYWPVCQTYSNTIAIKNEIVQDFLKGNKNEA